MAAVRIVNRTGRVKERFESNLDPHDEAGALALLHKRAHALGLRHGASIQVESRKGWITYRAS